MGAIMWPTCHHCHYNNNNNNNTNNNKAYSMYTHDKEAQYTDESEKISPPTDKKSAHHTHHQHTS